MSDHSGQQILTLTTTCWWQKSETRAVSKQNMHGVHMETFKLKELNEIEGKEQYHVEISNRFEALENLDTEVDIKGYKC
jgi:hypothetical protein